MKTFKIYNESTINFGLMDRLRILFGKEVKITTITHCAGEVEVFNKMTEQTVNVDSFRKPKSIGMQSPAILLLAFIFSLSTYAQDYDRSTIQTTFGWTKLRDETKLVPFNTGMSYRYMANTKVGFQVGGTYSRLYQKDDLTPEMPLSYLSGHLMGVLNLGRMADMQNVLNNRLTILALAGGDYTYSTGTTNDVIFHRLSDFHLTGSLIFEYRWTDQVFFTTGLNVVTGVNSRPTGFPETNTTSIINFNVGVAISIGKHKQHADWYVEKEREPITDTIFMQPTIIDRTVTNNVAAAEPTEGLEYVYFSHDSYTLDKDALANIEKTFEKAGDSIFVTSYCSNVGSDSYNIELAKKRAGAILEKLRALGYEGSIFTEAKGIDTERSENVHDMARRVVIKF